MVNDRAGRNTFPKSSRLLSSAEFDAVFEQKLSAADGWLVVYGKPNGRGHARLGLVVSRRVGNAVRRNRWKRMLREAFRLNQSELPPLDLVCLPRAPQPPKLSFVSGSLARLADKLAQKAARNAAREHGESQ